MIEIEEGKEIEVITGEHRDVGGINERVEMLERWTKIQKIKEKIQKGLIN